MEKKVITSVLPSETNNDFARYFGSNLALEVRLAMSKVIKQSEKE